MVASENDVACARSLDVVVPGISSSPWWNSSCIRPAMHPRWLRCSLTYSRYARSSRLVSGAPRRPRCNAGLSPRAARERRSPPMRHTSLVTRCGGLRDLLNGLTLGSWDYGDCAVSRIRSIGGLVMLISFPPPRQRLVCQRWTLANERANERASEQARERETRTL